MKVSEAIEVLKKMNSQDLVYLTFDVEPKDKYMSPYPTLIPHPVPFDLRRDVFNPYTVTCKSE